jgi:hypothetical protein
MAYDDWSDREVELIVADYFSMLLDELRGIKIHKTFHRQALIPLLNNRSDGSVEFKHQNISAVLVELGLPFIRGYKPRYNFQREKLNLFVSRYIGSLEDLDHLLEQFSESVPEPSKSPEFSSWIVSPPESQEDRPMGKTIRQPVKINYLEREQNNKTLGFKGEELAFAFEKKTLFDAGKASLADQIEWISKDQGDGLGFDILSRNLNGTDKYIEVKTTKLSKDSPFFFSSNEFKFSIEQSKNYHLYRIFNFSSQPKIFTLNGSFDAFCKIEPTNYMGSF